MLAFNRLRIDPGKGSPAVDYRIENGFVESRTLETDATKRCTLLKLICLIRTSIWSSGIA